MSSQTTLIVMIAVAFLIVLLALLIDEPSAAEDDPVPDLPSPESATLVEDDWDDDGVGNLDADLELGHVETHHEHARRVPVVYETETVTPETNPIHPWQRLEPEQGEPDDARRPAGLPSTPDR